MKLGGTKWRYGEIQRFVRESLRRAKIAHTIYCKRNKGKEIDRDDCNVEWWGKFLHAKAVGIEDLLIRLDEEYEKETGWKIQR